MQYSGLEDRHTCSGPRHGSDGSPSSRLTWAISLVSIWLSLTSSVAVCQTEPSPTASPSSDTKSTEDAQQAAGVEVVTKRARELAERIEKLRATDAKRAELLHQGVLRMLEQYSTSVDAKPQTPTAPTAASGKRPRFDVAQRTISRLNDVGAEDLANQFKKQLADMEAAISTKQYPFPKHDTPEVHVVSLNQGTTLPEHLKTKENRLTLGYAEVHLQYTARPIALVLKAQESILWNVIADAGVRVHAVIFESQQPQQLMGLERPLVLETRTASRDGLLYRTNGYVGSQLGPTLVGGEAVTEYSAPTYAGTPIVIGPSNSAWLNDFMIPTVESLIRDARQEWRIRKFNDLKNLRFQANYVTLPPSSHTTAPHTSVGEFSVIGPYADTLVPLRHHGLRTAVLTSKGDEQLEFGLDSNGQLVSLSTKQIPDRLTPVPPSASVLRHGNRFRAMAYDSKRHRMVLSTNTGQSSHIVAFDIENGEWSEVTKLPSPAVAMTYVEESDRIWLVMALRQRGANEDAELWKLASDGRVDEKVKLTESLGDSQLGNQRFAYYGSTWDNTFPQLIQHDQYAILVGLRYSRNRPTVRVTSPEIFVIESDSGDIVYSGTLRVASTDEEPTPQRVATDARPSFSILADLNRNLTRAAEAIEKLPEKRAETLSTRLHSVRDFMYGKFSKRSAPRLYVISSYRSVGPGIDIEVTDQSAPVVLVLCSQQASTWNVTKRKGVNLQRIILVGRVPQKLVSSPPGVEVTSHGTEAGFTILDPRNKASFETAANRLRELTGGLEIAASKLLYQQPDKPQQVGPEDGVLRLQLAQQSVQRILAEATSDRTSAVQQALEKKRFFGIHRGNLPRQKPNPNHDNRYLSEFTIHGPVIGTGQAITQRFQHTSFDNVNQRLFGVMHNQLWIVNATTGAQQQINLMEKNRRLGQVMGIAYDSKRDRLILTSHNRVFAFNPDTKEVTSLRLRNWLQEMGMVFSPSQDVFYAALPDRSGRGEIRHLNRYNRNGAMLETIEFSKAVARGQHFSSSRLIQLVDLDRYVAILDHPSNHRFTVVNGRRVRQAPQGTIAVVDTTNGEVVYEGSLTPRIARKDLSAQDLAQLWEKIGPLTPPNLDQLLWELAAGHDSTIAFVQSQIQPHDFQVDAIEIAALVKDLDDHRFSVRNAAFKKLQSFGSVLEPELQTFMKQELSTEASERLKSLLASWKSGDPQNDEERRRVRALEVLARIGNQRSRALLERFQGDQFDGLTRHHARRILNGSGEGGGLEFSKRLFAPK